MPVKRRLTLIITFLILTVSGRLAAQNSYYEEAQRTFYGGVTAGGNFSTIDNFSRIFKSRFSNYGKVGANIGGIVYARLKSNLMASMEILYSQKGRKTTGLVQTGISGVYFSRIYDRLNYVEVPVMLTLFDSKKNGIGAGVSYGRLVNSAEILETTPAISIPPGDYTFNGDDYEVLVGGQLHLWQNLSLAIRYQYSIVQIRKNVPTNFTPAGQNNNLWAVRLVYVVK